MRISSTKVLQKDVNGNVVASYDSIRSAAVKNDYPVDAISRVVRGIRKSAYGFIWESNGPGSVQSPGGKTVEQVDEDGRVIKSLPSMASGAREAGVCYRTFRIWLESGKNGWRVADV